MGGDIGKNILELQVGFGWINNEPGSFSCWFQWWSNFWKFYTLWGTFTIFLPISPPTKSVGGSNSGNRGYFWREIRCKKLFGKIQNFTLFRNKVWNLPKTANPSFEESDEDLDQGSTDQKVDRTGRGPAKFLKKRTRRDRGGPWIPDLDELNAHRRAENWIRRFNQQNYQAWNTTKGRPYVELGNIWLIYRTACL